MGRRLGALVPVMPEDMGGPKGFRTLRPIDRRLAGRVSYFIQI